MHVTDLFVADGDPIAKLRLENSHTLGLWWKLSKSEWHQSQRDQRLPQYLPHHDSESTRKHEDKRKKKHRRTNKTSPYLVKLLHPVANSKSQVPTTRSWLSWVTLKKRRTATIKTSSLVKRESFGCRISYPTLYWEGPLKIKLRPRRQER